MPLSSIQETLPSDHLVLMAAPVIEKTAYKLSSFEELLAPNGPPEAVEAVLRFLDPTDVHNVRKASEIISANPIRSSKRLTMTVSTATRQASAYFREFATTNPVC